MGCNCHHPIPGPDGRTPDGAGASVGDLSRRRRAKSNARDMRPEVASSAAGIQELRIAAAPARPGGPFGGPRRRRVT